MKAAWECNCIDTCKGQQFYSTSSSLQIKWFKKHHDNLLPNEVLGLSPDSPNATIFQNCATDFKPNDLIIGRSFSTRNGVGPIMKYVPPPVTVSVHNTHISMGIRLQVLMQPLILVEESAIRQITPMLHISKLSHGNYVTTENTSMVLYTTH